MAFGDAPSMFWGGLDKAFLEGVAETYGGGVTLSRARRQDFLAIPVEHRPNQHLRGPDGQLLEVKHHLVRKQLVAAGEPREQLCEEEQVSSATHGALL